MQTAGIHAFSFTAAWVPPAMLMPLGVAMLLMQGSISMDAHMHNIMESRDQWGLGRMHIAELALSQTVQGCEDCIPMMAEHNDACK